MIDECFLTIIIPKSQMCDPIYNVGRSDMNVDINKYVKKIITLDSNMQAYRKGSLDDVERYRERNEQKLASLNAELKEAEEKSISIKEKELSKIQKTIDKDNQEAERLLTASQKDFDAKKEQIVQQIFDELFV